MCKALAILTTAMEGSSIVFILQMKNQGRFTIC